MAESHQLSSAQLRGLAKVGDIMIPGDGELPSFSRSGALNGIDRMLDYMTASDLAGVKFLFSLFSFLPRLLIRGILTLTEYQHVLPGPLGSACRMVNLGVKGVVMTLYYSDLGAGNGPSVLRLIAWDSKIVEADASGANIDPLTLPLAEGEGGGSPNRSI